MAADRGDAAGAAGHELERRLMRIPALAMFAIAALALIAAAVLALRSAACLLGAERIEGEVVRIDSRTFIEDELTRTAYWPVVRYLAANNEPAEWKGPAALELSTHGPGDKVALLRGAGSEPRIETHEFSSLWQWPVVCVVLAWTFAGIGVVMRLVDVEGAHHAVAAFLLVVGVPLVLGGVARGAIDFVALRTGQRASGVVGTAPRVEVAGPARASSASGLVQDRVRVRFTATDGRAVELVDGRRQAADFRPGASVDVLYPAGRPYAGRIYTPRAYWLATMIQLALGAVLVGVGARLLRRAR